MLLATETSLIPMILQSESRLEIAQSFVVGRDFSFSVAVRLLFIHSVRYAMDKNINYTGVYLGEKASKPKKGETKRTR